jgi:hypothetical protein
MFAVIFLRNAMMVHVGDVQRFGTQINYKSHSIECGKGILGLN